MSTEVRLNKLLNLSRFSDHGINMVLLLAYAPLGLALVLFRLLFSIQLLLILAVVPKSFPARRWILRINLMILGLILTTDGHEWIDESANVIIANRVSMFDCLLVEMIRPCIMPISYSDLPYMFNWILQYKKYGSSTRNIIEVLKKEMKGLMYPLLCFPECCATNAKAGLLKFNKWPFEIGSSSYQPVMISPSSWQFFNRNVTTLGSSFSSDFLWILFSPVTVFHISILPSMKQKDDNDSPEEFAKAVEQEMAKKTGIAATSYTAQDVKDYVKLTTRSSRGQTRRNQSERSTNNDVAKVKDVLPQVPLAVIKSDLLVTKSVDVTLMNLLNGTLSYVPLTDAEQAEETRLLNEQQNLHRQLTERSRTVIPLTKHNGKSTSSASNILCLDNNTNFMTDRTLSFSDKKAIMIERARRKYIEAHPEMTLLRNGEGTSA